MPLGAGKFQQDRLIDALAGRSTAKLPPGYDPEFGVLSGYRPQDDISPRSPYREVDAPASVNIEDRRQEPRDYLREISGFNLDDWSRILKNPMATWQDIFPEKFQKADMPPPSPLSLDAGYNNIGNLIKALAK